MIDFPRDLYCATSCQGSFDSEEWLSDEAYEEGQKQLFEIMLEACRGGQKIVNGSRALFKRQCIEALEPEAAHLQLPARLTTPSSLLDPIPCLYTESLPLTFAPELILDVEREEARALLNATYAERAEAVCKSFKSVAQDPNASRTSALELYDYWDAMVHSYKHWMKKAKAV